MDAEQAYPIGPIRHFIVFEKMKHEDLDTGIITIKTTKKMAANSTML